MKAKIKQLIANPFLSGSVVIMVGSNLANVLNYFYHPLMARLLGVGGYGELASLISLLGVLSIVAASLGLVITRLVSSAEAGEGRQRLINEVNNRLVWISLGLGLALIVVSPLMASFLRLDNPRSAGLLIGVLFFFMLNAGIRASLQGLLKFKLFVSSLIFENILKIGLGAGLVLIGWQVNGAMLGFMMASALSWWLFRQFVVKPTQGGVERLVSAKGLLIGSLPFLIMSLSITLFYSMDLILVKHFFSSEAAGGYAALSVLSRIVFFGTGPIVMVMFPLVASRYAQKGDRQEFKRIFWLSLAMVLGISLGVVGLFGRWPDSVVSFSYGDKYLVYSALLLRFSVFILLVAMSNLIANFLLAVGKTRFTALLVAAALMQVIGIILWHNSLVEVITVSTAVTVALLMALGVVVVKVLTD